MADSESAVKLVAICHTCVTVLEKYGTTESVVPWLCNCTTESLSSPNSKPLQDKLSWSKMSPEVQRITWRNHNPPSK